MHGGRMKRSRRRRRRRSKIWERRGTLALQVSLALLACAVPLVVRRPVDTTKGAVGLVPLLGFGGIPTACAEALPFEQERWLREEEWAQASMQGMDTRMVIDGEVYDPVCSCKVPAPENTRECYPRKVKITRRPSLDGTLAPGRLVLDGINLRRLVGDPADLRFVESKRHYFSDIDGRSSEEVLGVWGGRSRRASACARRLGRHDP